VFASPLQSPVNVWEGAVWCAIVLSWAAWCGCGCAVIVGVAIVLGESLDPIKLLGCAIGIGGMWVYVCLSHRRCVCVCV
jgi:multidrug transporter EmrE-like cation transporter